MYRIRALSLCWCVCAYLLRVNQFPLKTLQAFVRIAQTCHLLPAALFIFFLRNFIFTFPNSQMPLLLCSLPVTVYHENVPNGHSLDINGTISYFSCTHTNLFSRLCSQFDTAYNISPLYPVILLRIRWLFPSFFCFGFYHGWTLACLRSWRLF